MNKVVLFHTLSDELEIITNAVLNEDFKILWLYFINNNQRNNLLYRQLAYLCGPPKDKSNRWTYLDIETTLQAKYIWTHLCFILIDLNVGNELIKIVENDFDLMNFIQKEVLN